MYKTFYQNVSFMFVEYQRLIPYPSLGVSSSEKIGIRQAHWLDLVNINPCAKNYQSISKVSGVMDIFAVTFWPLHFLGLGKVAFGNSFV